MPGLTGVACRFHQCRLSQDVPIDRVFPRETDDVSFTVITGCSPTVVNIAYQRMQLVNVLAFATARPPTSLLK